jgi:hypothetical protein
MKLKATIQSSNVFFFEIDGNVIANDGKKMMIN